MINKDTENIGWIYLERVINPALTTSNKLSQMKANPQVAQQVAKGGAPNIDGAPPEDDIIQTKPISIAANQLNAGQNSMDVDKFIQQAIQMFGKIPPFKGPGGELGAIISNDLYMMDGHHRWVATMLVNPEASLGGTQVMLNYEPLLGVLNAWTTINKKEAKTATEKFSALTGDRIKARFIELCQSGWQGKYPLPPEKIKQAFDQRGIPFEQAAEQAKRNFDAFAEKWREAADRPDKVEMPVIEDEKGDAGEGVRQVKTDLESGTFDIVTGNQSQRPTQPQATPQTQRPTQPQATHPQAIAASFEYKGDSKLLWEVYQDILPLS
jgi:hypothetical protein